MNSKSKSSHCATAAWLISIILFFPVNSFAGSRSDHFAAWINLETTANGKAISKIINGFANSNRIDSTCNIEWENNDSLLYLNSRQLKIPAELTRRVFIERDNSSFKELSLILRSFRDPDANVRDGLDGLFFYDEENSLRMMSFTTGQRKIKVYPSILKASTDPRKIERAFCTLLPPIVRAP